MSIEATEVPKLSKEEKKAKKEEKRRRKEAKAAKAAAKSATASGISSIAPSTVESTPVPDVDDKKDKKRKLESEVVAVGGGEIAEAKVKKSKKEKKDKKDVSVVGAGEGQENGGLSKKQLKKLAKASTAPSLVPSAVASTSSTPAQVSASAAPQAGKWTAADREYFKSNSIKIASSLNPVPEFSPITQIPTLPVAGGIAKWMSKFTTPTPIQASTWPALLAGSDVVGIAETGSGKTLAFGVPGMQLLVSSSSHPASSSSAAAAAVNGEEGRKSKKAKSGGGVRMLVIAPTRELALQSHETLEALGKDLGVGSVCIYGGAPKDLQIAAIRKKETQIVVGTPGRVLDLADSGDLDLSKVAYLVLDEADRMLDQGFENDIRRIFAHCPEKESRQTVMFSATWPESVRRLAQTFLKDPLQFTIGSDELSANKRIEQIVEVLDDGRQKDGRTMFHLRAHLKAYPSSPASPTRILVFALYKKEAQRIENTLSRSFSVAGLHGDLSQDARFKALDRFKRGEVNVLVATDVAARGLDIPDVGLVLNVTFPLTTEDFVHRCGRTGRAGKSGKAVTFFTGENHERSLAGEFVRVLRDAGAEVPKEMDRFPLTVKKKEHGAYGAFYKDISNAPAPTKITFD